MKTNEPLRGPRYRSRAFQEYYLRQTPGRQAEILAGEQKFNELHADPGSIAGHAELQYRDDLTLPVPADTPAGVADRLDLLEDPLLPGYQGDVSRE